MSHLGNHQTVFGHTHGPIWGVPIVTTLSFDDTCLAVYQDGFCAISTPVCPGPAEAALVVPNEITVAVRRMANADKIICI